MPPKSIKSPSKKASPSAKKSPAPSKPSKAATAKAATYKPSQVKQIIKDVLKSGTNAAPRSKGEQKAFKEIVTTDFLTAMTTMGVAFTRKFADLSDEILSKSGKAIVKSENVYAISTSIMGLILADKVMKEMASTPHLSRTSTKRIFKTRSSLKLSETTAGELSAIVAAIMKVMVTEICNACRDNLKTGGPPAQYMKSQQKEMYIKSLQSQEAHAIEKAEIYALAVPGTDRPPYFVDLLKAIGISGDGGYVNTDAIVMSTGGQKMHKDSLDSTATEAKIKRNTETKGQQRRVSKVKAAAKAAAKAEAERDSDDDSDSDFDFDDDTDED